MSVQPAEPTIVGRDAELEAIGTWLEGPRPALLEIEGDAGIGKTTLWEAATRLARASAAAVLAYRPVEIETAVSYGALASLLEPALAVVGGTVPRPRRRALEGALRLRDVTGSSLDETAVALGALSVVRALAGLQPVVLAVDDVQWLDSSSRVALTYALRNLGAGDDVAVVLTRRHGSGDGSLDLTGSALAETAQHLRPGPLSIGAVHRMTHARLGAPLSRPQLVRIHAASHGNPLHALELARAVAGSQDTVSSAPESLPETLRTRIEALSAGTRSLLLAVAAAGDPRPELLDTAMAPRGAEAELEEALRSGVLVLLEGRVRFSHPLLASTVYEAAGEPERSLIHARLAQLAEMPEERARHLALSGTVPDEVVAAELEHAAESACRRGARGTGAELYEQAARLTPAERTETRDVRLVAAADAYFQAGASEHARVLLESVGAGQSPTRFVALSRLGTLLDETVGGQASLTAFEAALAADDPAVAAEAHRGLAQALAYVGSLDRALEHADAAVDVAESLGDMTVLVYALAMQALIRKLAGHPAWRGPLERGLALESEVDLPELDASPSAVDADTRRVMLELDEARAAFEAMLAQATERGDVRTECWCRFGLASVEIASGRWDDASRHAQELWDLAEQTELLRLPALRSSAQLALLRGDVDRARALIGAVVVDAEPSGELHNLRAVFQLEGHLELSLGDHRAALAPLGHARAIAQKATLGEPSLLLVLLDEVEALAATGDAATAAAVLEEFERRCAGDTAAWIAPVVQRARGLVHAANRDLDAAVAALEAAVALEQDLPLPLERARSRLALGRVLRRGQHRSAAHAMLTTAVALFEELGATLWVERAREELARLGGRAPAGDELTPTERRIAELVAEGLTNREVAATLFVTPKTVESALTRIYRKLDVRSRTELARQLASPD